MSMLSILSDDAIANETFNYGDTDFVVWIVLAAIFIVALFCIVEVAVYNVRLRRAAEFKDKYE